MFPLVSAMSCHAPTAIKTLPVDQLLKCQDRASHMQKTAWASNHAVTITEQLQELDLTFPQINSGHVLLFPLPGISALFPEYVYAETHEHTHRNTQMCAYTFSDRIKMIIPRFSPSILIYLSNLLIFLSLWSFAPVESKGVGMPSVFTCSFAHFMKILGNDEQISV